MNQVEEIFALAFGHGDIHLPVIACLATGPTDPIHCAPMPRTPAPATGMPLDTTFQEILLRASRLNPAVHDGAIMLRRRSDQEAYSILGWSYRLFPPPGTAEPHQNRGSAFNSCFAMSQQEDVDALYLLNADGLTVFEEGRVRPVDLIRTSRR